MSRPSVPLSQMIDLIELNWNFRAGHFSGTLRLLDRVQVSRSSVPGAAGLDTCVLCLAGMSTPNVFSEPVDCGLYAAHAVRCSRLAAHLRLLRFRYCLPHQAYSPRRTVAQAVPRATAQLSEHKCRWCSRQGNQPLSAPAASDSFAPKRRATQPAARQRLRPDARICGGEVS